MIIRIFNRVLSLGRSKKETTKMVTYIPLTHVLEPGRIIYLDDVDRFILPNIGDNSEEYW